MILNEKSTRFKKTIKNKKRAFIVQQKIKSYSKYNSRELKENQKYTNKNTKIFNKSNQNSLTYSKKERAKS